MMSFLVRTPSRRLRLTLIAVALLLTQALSPRPALAVTEVELDGTVVAIRSTMLTLTVDGADITLDAGEVDPRFLGSLKAGDDLRVTSFKLEDGSLQVYNIFLHPDREPHDQPPNEEPQADG